MLARNAIDAARRANRDIAAREAATARQLAQLRLQRPVVPCVRHPRAVLARDAQLDADVIATRFNRLANDLEAAGRPADARNVRASLQRYLWRTKR